MITKFKKYKNIKEKVDIYNLFHTEKNRDDKYYIDLIKKGEINKYDLERLFHWCCVFDFQELAFKISKYIDNQTLYNLIRSITYLKYDYFKKIIEKDDLYKLLFKDRYFVEYIFNYSEKDEIVKKLKLIKKLGYKFIQNDLETACFKDRTGVDIIKYLTSLGLDPKKKKPSTFSHKMENCLDISTNYNENSEKIKYLVEELKIPITYRHMHNVIVKNNLESLKVLINNMDNLIDDYSYSDYATHSEDKYKYVLYDIVSLMYNKKLFEYLKMFIKNLNKTELITRTMTSNILSTYDFQKILLDADPNNLKYIEHILSDRIKEEYSYLIDSKKFNV